MFQIKQSLLQVKNVLFIKLANAVHVQEQRNTFQCSLNYIQAQHWFRQISVSRFTLYCSQHSHAYHTTHWPQICSISQAVCRCRGTQVNAFHSAKGNPSSQNACHQAANVKASLAKHCFQVNGLS